MKTGSAFKLLLLPILLILCTLFYYFGELVQWAAWDSLGEEFFYSVHDIHRLLFLAPIIYAGYFRRVKGAIIVTLITLAIFLPRALFVSPYPDPLLRMIFFVIIAGVIGSLTGAIRNQSEKNTRLQEEIHSEKLNAMGQIAASIAHEINNPLAGVLVYNRLLSKKLSNDSLDKGEALETLDKIESAVSHCSQVVRGLLDFAGQSEPVFTPLAISKVIDQAISLIGHQAKMNNVEIVRKDAANLSPVKGDIGQLQQVFMNLIINAIQSMPDGGTVAVTTGSDNNGRISVSIKDTGHGIEPENMEKLFTPFFTTRESGKCVGLGLVVSQGIIERYGGSIEVMSSIGAGSTFTVFLPSITKGCN